MSDKITVLLVWNGSDFTEADPQIPIEEDKTFIFIDENTEQFIYRISSEESAINSRIIQRRIQSLAKNGYRFSSNLRINTSSFQQIQTDESFNLKRIRKKAKKGSLEPQNIGTTRPYIDPKKLVPSYSTDELVPVSEKSKDSSDNLKHISSASRHRSPSTSETEIKETGGINLTSLMEIIENAIKRGETIIIEPAEQAGRDVHYKIYSKREENNL